MTIVFIYASMLLSLMDKEKVIAAVKGKAEKLPGVIAVEFLSPEFRERLIELEQEAERNGACGGLMPFTNQGVWESFKREQQFILVIESGTLILGSGNGLVYISDQKGQIVGEWINPERFEELKDRKDVCFLSSDFVLYPDVHPEGSQYFVLPQIDFPYLNDIPGVKNVTSGSISTLADDYVRAQLGFAGTRHWTHLVGFDVASD